MMKSADARWGDPFFAHLGSNIYRLWVLSLRSHDLICWVVFFGVCKRSVIGFLSLLPHSLSVAFSLSLPPTAFPTIPQTFFVFWLPSVLSLSLPLSLFSVLVSFFHFLPSTSTSIPPSPLIPTCFAVGISPLSSLLFLWINYLNRTWSLCANSAHFHSFRLTNQRSFH